MDTRNGTVKWFNDEKGFGFIKSDTKEYFVHYKDINGSGFKSLKEGDAVKFTAANSAKGWVAKEVSKT